METNYETWSKDRLIGKIYDLEATVESLKTVTAENDVLGVKDRFKLTLKEARLLTALADGRPHSKRAIYEFVYHDEFDDPPEMKIIDVFICKIRKKIFPFGMVIETIHSAGYRLNDAELMKRVMAGEVNVGLPTEEYQTKNRQHGENEKAILAVLLSELDGTGRAKIQARVLAKKSGLKVPLLPLMTKLESKGIIVVKSRPDRKKRLDSWVVQVKARAL